MAEEKKEVARLNVQGECALPNGNKLVLTHYAPMGFDDNLVVIDPEGDRLWGITDVHRYGGAVLAVVYDDGTFSFNTFEGVGGIIDAMTFEMRGKEFSK